MSFDFKSRNCPFTKEHEVINKISKLLRLLTTSYPESLAIPIQPQINIPPKKFAARTKSLCPKVTMFDFASSKLVKPPAQSNTALPEISQKPITSLKKTYRVHRRHEQTYMLPKKLKTRKFQSCAREDYDKYRKILDLTEEMINKENIVGWSNLM